MANYVTTKTAEQSLVSALFKSLYMQMAAALTITGLTAWFVANSPAMISFLYSNSASIWILAIAQIGVVIWLSSRLFSMSTTTATMLFIIYSVLTGMTLSSIFLIYSGESIAATFLVTAGTFLVMSIIGYVTKMDLTKLGSILYMLLIGLIIASVVNIFLASSSLYWITTYVGVIVFVGLIAWDTQKIRNAFVEHGSYDESAQKIALLGALMLYLDFINLFLYLIRILGGGRE
ncbi:MAG: Bax inhibitor-1/YccA family protein [Alistipes sp.]|nr:Bax inhibitor-1/YccA family protein [Alistipes sp.]